VEASLVFWEHETQQATFRNLFDLRLGSVQCHCRTRLFMVNGIGRHTAVSSSTSLINTGTKLCLDNYLYRFLNLIYSLGLRRVVQCGCRARLLLVSGIRRSSSVMIAKLGLDGCLDHFLTRSSRASSPSPSPSPTWAGVDAGFGPRYRRQTSC
jgi:hypothetical protein